MRADQRLSGGEGFGVCRKLKSKHSFAEDTGETASRREEGSDSGVTGG